MKCLLIENESHLLVCAFSVAASHRSRPVADPNLSPAWYGHVNHPEAAVNKCCFYGLYISAAHEWKQMGFDRPDEPSVPPVFISLLGVILFAVKRWKLKLMWCLPVPLTSHWEHTRDMQGRVVSRLVIACEHIPLGCRGALNEVIHFQIKPG